jgi:hypothetical protein
MFSLSSLFKLPVRVAILLTSFEGSCIPGGMVHRIIILLANHLQSVCIFVFSNFYVFHLSFFIFPMVFAKSDRKHTISTCHW